MSDAFFGPFLSDSEIAELALRIESQILQHHGFDRLQHDVIDWDANSQIQRSAEAAFWRRRAQHEVYIRILPLLRDEEAGPLLPEWHYDFCPRWHDDQGNPTTPFCGWFPPELARANMPEHELPLPASKRELSIIERHAALAAIHDMGARGVPKINPWPDADDLSHVTAILEGRRPPVEGICYTRLLNTVEQIPAEDKPHIEAWCDRLEAELGDVAVGDSILPRGEDHCLDFPVTLQQAAAVAGLSKRTLEGYLKQGKLPAPDIVGGEGRANRWYWKRLRPSLEQCTRRILPNSFPGSRIIP